MTLPLTALLLPGLAPLAGRIQDQAQCLDYPRIPVEDLMREQLFWPLLRPLLRPLFRPLLVSALLILPAGLATAATAQEGEPDPAAGDPPAAAVEEASSVARAAVCTEVVERAPQGAADRFDAEVGRLYCFTEIRGLEGSTITHAWIHEGTTRARVQLPVRSSQWRTWSSKTLAAGWTGAWQVKILDADGIVLKTLDFVLE